MQKFRPSPKKKLLHSVLIIKIMWKPCENTVCILVISRPIILSSFFFPHFFFILSFFFSTLLFQFTYANSIEPHWTRSFSIHRCQFHRATLHKIRPVINLGNQIHICPFHRVTLDKIFFNSQMPITLHKIRPVINLGNQRLQW